MSRLAQVATLIEYAQSALLVKDNYDGFLEHSQKYLDALEAWQKDFATEIQTAESSLSVVSSELKVQLKKLSVVHQQLMTMAYNEKDKVSSELGEINKRAGSIKKYLDRLPSRVSITGKKKW